MGRRDALQVYDPLYGEVTLPGFLRPLLHSPEFQRLSGVRLLNCDSLQLAGLSEARRRSHTLGVLHLATKLPLVEYGPEDVQALLCAIVLHDVGTPPFGHTVEYEYIRLLSIDHEEFITHILNGDHHSDRYAHQIGRRQINLHRVVANTGLDDRIRAIVSGQHPLSTALKSDIDVDNIDNVFRMAWFLGIRCDPKDAERLVASIHIDRHGTKIASETIRPMVQEWARLRAAAYRMLLDSAPHRQSQAILSSIMAAALTQPNNVSNEQIGTYALLDQDDWLLTDEAVIAKLRKADRLKGMFKDYDSQAPLTELTFEFRPQIRLDRPTLMQHRDAIAACLAEFGVQMYVTLLPYGEALTRKVRFKDSVTGADWSIGSPELIYRLHIHVGGSRNARARFTTLIHNVETIIDEYAIEQGWNIESRSQLGAP